MSARSQSHFNGPGPLLSVRDVETHRLLNDIASSGRDCLAIDLAAAPAARHGIPWRRGLHAPLLEQARCRPIGEGRVGDGDLRRRRRRRGDRDDAARRRAGKGDGAPHAGPPAGRRAMRGRAPPRGPTPTAGPPVQGAAAAGTPGAPRPESCIGACLCARAAETESPSNAAVP